MRRSFGRPCRRQDIIFGVSVRAILASTFRFVPEAVALIDKREVTRTPLGKVRRLQLATQIGDIQFEKKVHRLDSQTSPPANPASDEIEQELRSAWTRLLNCSENVYRDSNFFAMGGDSVLASTLLMGVEKRFKRQIALREFFDLPTFNNLVAGASDAAANDHQTSAWPLPHDFHHRLLSYVEGWKGERVSEDRLMFGANRQGSLPPLFCVINAEYELANLAAALGSEQPVYALRSLYAIQDYTEDMIQALALRYVKDLERAYPTGPLFLLAHCRGCDIALPIAQHLLRRGRDLPLLVLVESMLEPVFFPGRVLILYGRESTYNPKVAGFNPEPAWRRMFGEFSRAEFDGGHDVFLDHTASLAGELRRCFAQALRRSGKFSPLEDQSAEFAVDMLPSRARPGACLPLEVSVRNVGKTAIGGESSSLRLGGCWTRDGVAYGARFIEAASLPATAPGESSIVRITVSTPESEGSFELALDLFEERGHSSIELGAASACGRIKITRNATPIRQSLRPYFHWRKRIVGWTRG